VTWSRQADGCQCFGVVFLFLLQDGRLFYTEVWANTLFRNLGKYPEKSEVQYENHEILLLLLLLLLFITFMEAHGSAVG
jgi:hypothetical protein